MRICILLVCCSSIITYSFYLGTENLAFCSDETSLLESDLDVPKFRSIISSDANNEVGFDPDQSISSSGHRNSDIFIIEGTLSGKNKYSFCRKIIPDSVCYDSFNFFL